MAKISHYKSHYINRVFYIYTYIYIYIHKVINPMNVNHSNDDYILL